MNSIWKRARKTLRPSAPKAAPIPQGKHHATVASALITAATGAMVVSARTPFIDDSPGFGPRESPVRARSAEALPEAFHQ